MSVTKDLTTGDKGVVFSGWFTDPVLVGLANLSGWSATFALLSVPDTGTPIIAETAATITPNTFDPVAGSVHLSYTHASALSVSVQTMGRVRFTMTDGSNDIKHGPSSQSAQTYIRINR